MYESNQLSQPFLSPILTIISREVTWGIIPDLFILFIVFQETKSLGSSMC